MKNVIIATTFFLIGFVSLCACKKQTTTIPPDNPYGLPNATQTGAGIFAYRLNNQNWLAKNDIHNQIAKYSYDSSFVGGQVGHLYATLVSIHVKGNIKLNTPYAMFNNTVISFFLASDSSCVTAPPPALPVENIFTAMGTTTFTRADSINRIVSGIFAFQVPFPDCDTMNITDGRFDIHY